MSSQTPRPPEGNTAGPSGHARRGFLAGAGAIAAAGLAFLAPVWSGLRVVFDPLRRTARDPALVPVTRLAAVPADGVPRKFRVVTDRVDAWNTQRNMPVGAVYLRRTEDSLQALNVICPHAGCFVNLAPDHSRYECPCHKSSFDIEGAVNDPASPSPRDMDELEVEVREGDEIWVRFQNFLPGRPDKTPVA